MTALMTAFTSSSAWHVIGGWPGIAWIQASVAGFALWDARFDAPPKARSPVWRSRFVRWFGVNGIVWLGLLALLWGFKA